MTLPSESSNEPSAVPEFSSRRARMLVTMLGADFTKTAQHPFFDRLINLATSEGERSYEAKPTDQGLSLALRALVARLDSAGVSSAAAADKHNAQNTSPTHQAAEREPSDRAEEAEPTAIDALKDQHPVVIANTARNLTSKQRAVLLRALPGNVARQVFSILQNLE